MDRSLALSIHRCDFPYLSPSHILISRKPSLSIPNIRGARGHLLISFPPAPLAPRRDGSKISECQQF
jgi:hypothetical protein